MLKSCRSVILTDEAERRQLARSAEHWSSLPTEFSKLEYNGRATIRKARCSYASRAVDCFEVRKWKAKSNTKHFKLCSWRYINVSLSNHRDQSHSKIVLSNLLCKLAIRMLGVINSTKVIFLLVRTSVMRHMITRVHDISWRSISRNWQLRTSERYCLKTNNILVNILINS